MKSKLLAVAALALAVSLVWAQGGGQGKGGGERRGMGGRGMSSVEMDWAALCFEINMTSTQIEKLRPTFKWAWQSRNNALKSAMTSHNFDSLGKTMEYVNKTVADRLKIVLTKDQQAQWTKYKAEQAKLRASRAFGRGGPGGGKAK